MPLVGNYVLNVVAWCALLRHQFNPLKPTVAIWVQL